MGDPDKPRLVAGPRLLVVGTGLIGTSAALAARAAGYQVWLDDIDADRVAVAVSVGAGQRWTDTVGDLDLAVIAAPPPVVVEVAIRLLRSDAARTIAHVCSVQSQPQVEVEALVPGDARFIGSHPIAGRERSGPHHASADLFAQRPWVVCPTPHTGVQAVRAISDLAGACGAVVTEMTAERHDALLARLSHAPQLVASALAATLMGLDRAEAGLAGTGLRDTTRLADSDPRLWAGIVAANRAPVAAALREVVDPLQRLAAVLEADPAADDPQVHAAVLDLVRLGRAGRGRLAGKHGQPAVRWGTVSVVVPDEPGALARLLADAARAEVNVEDIRVDHSPGQPVGMVELDVAPSSAEPLARALAERSWTATASPPGPE